MKEKIKEKKKELVELLEQLRKMKEDEAGDCPRVDATENRPQADEDAPQMAATAQTLSYVLNGKAGKFTKDLRVVTLGDLEEGLLHLDEDKQNSKAEATRKKTNLKPVNYGATSCWIPAGAAVIGKKDLTKLNQKAEIVKRGDVDACDDGGVYDGFQHQFGKKEIVLDHNEGDLPPIKIKTDECMEYLTNGVNPFEILKIPLIAENKTLLWRIATVPHNATAVDIFDDKTWAVGHDGSKHDFVTLLDEVHKRIAPHCTHGQGVENHVQAAGFVRKTNVGEERGSHRGTANSYISRRFNMISVLKLKAKKSTKEEKDRIQRVWGSTRITYFSDFVDKFARSVEEAAKNMDEVKRNELYAFIGSEQSRQSTKDKKELVNKVKTGAKKTRNVTKSEFVGGVEVTAEMDGGILFSILTKKNGHEEHVDAEIVERKIESKLSKPLADEAIGKKLELLKSEALLEKVEAKRAAPGDKPPNCIIPRSAKMKSLYPKQRELVAERRARK